LCHGSREGKSRMVGLAGQLAVGCGTARAETPPESIAVWRRRAGPDAGAGTRVGLQAILARRRAIWRTAQRCHRPACQTALVLARRRDACAQCRDVARRADRVACGPLGAAHRFALAIAKAGLVRRAHSVRRACRRRRAAARRDARRAFVRSVRQAACVGRVPGRIVLDADDLTACDCRDCRHGTDSGGYSEPSVTPGHLIDARVHGLVGGPARFGRAGGSGFVMVREHPRRGPDGGGRRCQSVVEGRRRACRRSDQGDQGRASSSLCPTVGWPLRGVNEVSDSSVFFCSKTSSARFSCPAAMTIRRLGTPHDAAIRGAPSVIRSSWVLTTDRRS
jgi:hypothetical protein